MKSNPETVAAVHFNTVLPEKKNYKKNRHAWVTKLFTYSVSAWMHIIQ